MVAAIRALSVNVCNDTVRLLVPDSIIAPESPQALPAVHGAFMSKILNCDPNKGFVAFPVALFDLDLTPAAFRTLAELCRMANTSGQCWPSLAQLGRRLGRSRASISTYIAELREAGVLTTEEQKMANGYNYRLRYTVTFWKKWRAGLGAEQKTDPTPQHKEPERSVQPAVRPLKTKNHIHKKQQLVSDHSNLADEWCKAVGNAPYPTFSRCPTEKMIHETQIYVENTAPSNPVISADIKAALKAFAQRREISEDFDEAAEALVPLVTSKITLEVLIKALDASWQAHWKKPPNSFQLLRILKALPPSTDEATQQKLLKSYLRRWKLHLESLPSTTLHSRVAA
ncbi:helix-turn-helix domain-containing protein [uncultured Sulfitobacter sp.]|uniref:helix-turn-helix domain-containing protein n=1 Tax=uncultured Sulfitobacter sp. TaxID=191468 RepID=UPI0026186B26|nr:helix-turn-helix domain-containing protein [uncultured Sulfitobacter sp.]